MASNPANSSDTIAIPWRSRRLHVVVSTMLVAVLGVSLISPILPVIRDTFDITSAEVGLVITVYAIPGIFLAPIVGVLADRYGRRVILLPCLFIFGLGGTAVAFVDTFTALLVLRFFQGIGASGLSTLAIALIGDYWDGLQRNAIMGINSTILSVGTSTYPLIGGTLAIIAWNVPFLLYILGVILGIVAFFILEEPDIEKNTSSNFGYIRDAIANVSLRESIILYGFTFLIFFTLFGALLTLVPLLLSEQYELSASFIGLVLTGSSLTSGLVASQNGRLAQYLTNIELIGIGFTIYGISLIGIGLFQATIPVWGIAGIIVLFGVGSGLSIPSMNTAVSSFTPPRFRGGAVSVRTSFIRLGESVGPAIFPFTAVLFGYTPVFLFAGVLLFCMGSIVWIRRNAEFRESPA